LHLDIRAAIKREAAVRPGEHLVDRRLGKHAQAQPAPMWTKRWN
jgi:hypothetical protein